MLEQRAHFTCDTRCCIDAAAAACHPFQDFHFAFYFAFGFKVSFAITIDLLSGPNDYVN
jgi:hypothetical protein